MEILKKRIKLGPSVETPTFWMAVTFKTCSI